MKKCILLLLTFSISSMVYSQAAEPAVFQHHLKTNTTDVKVGEEATLVFTATIPEGSLIYATGYTDCPPIAAVVRLDSSSSYTASSDLVSIHPETYTDDIFECDVAIFKETATFEQKVKIMEKTDRISGVLEYQICTKDGYCVLFNYPFKLDVTVNPW